MVMGVYRGPDGKWYWPGLLVLQAFAEMPKMPPMPKPKKQEDLDWEEGYNAHLDGKPIMAQTDARTEMQRVGWREARGAMSAYRADQKLGIVSPAPTKYPSPPKPKKFSMMGMMPAILKYRRRNKK